MNLRASLIAGLAGCMVAVACGPEATTGEPGGGSVDAGVDATLAETGTGGEAGVPVTPPGAKCGVGGTCAGGLSCCDGICISTAADNNNCGACGKLCQEQGNAERTCVAGKCSFKQCKAGFSDCNGTTDDGCEASTSEDPNNCGACGNKCPAAANTRAVCNGGKCGLAACDNQYKDCDNKSTNGCETNLQTDVNNCNACGAICTVANAKAKCAAGACAIDTCNADFKNCDNNPANGCERNTKTDPNHCGDCNQVCSTRPNTAAVCTAGQCTTCNTGFLNCDGNLTNGCEVSGASNDLNCGACGTTTSNAQFCSGGNRLNCPNGTANCNKSPTGSNCEINIQSDRNNCGGCGTSCAAQGKPECRGGACASCDANVGNCDGNLANGCETFLINNRANCGACGNNCANAGQPECRGTTCTGCDPGFDNCDGSLATGCETPLENNRFNCGACGYSCPNNEGQPECRGTSCASCDANYANCNGDLNDGCEVDLLNDGNNCGSCGNFCPNGCDGNGNCNP